MIFNFFRRCHLCGEGIFHPPPFSTIVKCGETAAAMKKETYVRRSRIEAPAEDVYAWHMLPEALERLTPPGEHLEVVERTGGIEPGARVVLRFGQWPFRRRWVAEHGEYVAGRYFTDAQVSGPFALWKHTHRFEPDGPAACFLEDRVEYALPFGFLGRWFAGWFVRKKLERMFAYRHRRTALEIAAFRKGSAG
jgi:uncharacterized protein